MKVEDTNVILTQILEQLKRLNENLSLIIQNQAAIGEVLGDGLDNISTSIDNIEVDIKMPEEERIQMPEEELTKLDIKRRPEE